MVYGGEGGIRTHGTVTRTTVFETVVQAQIGTGGRVNSRWLQVRDLNLQIDSRIMVPWAESPFGSGKVPQYYQSVAHQLIKDLLVSANRTKRGPFVVVLLGGAWVSVLKKP